MSYIIVQNCIDTRLNKGENISPEKLIQSLVDDAVLSFEGSKLSYASISFRSV